MIVVDASAVLELLLRTPSGLRVEHRMLADHACAPHLLDADVFHRIVTMGKHGHLDGSEVVSGVADLADAPIARVDHRPLFDLAADFSAAMSGYDALYAALARVTSATLVTADRRLARTATERFAIAALDVTVADTRRGAK